MKAIATAASGTRHAMGAVAEALLIAVIAGSLLVAFAPVNGSARLLSGAGDAAAARSNRGTTTSISVPDGVFGGTTTARTSAGLWVHVSCFVGESLAMSSWERTDATGQATFGLGPTASWTSGGASCKADAGSYNNRSKFVVSGSTSFNVSG